MLYKTHFKISICYKCVGMLLIEFCDLNSVVCVDHTLVNVGCTCVMCPSSVHRVLSCINYNRYLFDLHMFLCSCICGCAWLYTYMKVRVCFYFHCLRVLCANCVCVNKCADGIRVAGAGKGCSGSSSHALPFLSQAVQRKCDMT